MEGYEADDVLGSVARIAMEQGLGVKIITGDRDLLQLVNQRTAVYLAGDELNYITEQDVVKKLGVRPDQVVDYKALVGDKSDNIPGVPGVGEKTAISLLEKFGTLDGIYKNIDQVENRWKNKLEAGKELAYRSYNLALIRTDLQVNFDLEHARSDIERDIVARFDQIELFFKDLEFRTLIKTLEKLAGRDKGGIPGSNSPGLFAHSGAPQSLRATSGQMSMFVNQPQVISPRISSNIEVVIVDTTQKLEALVQELSKAEVISFDTETTSTEEMRADLVGISLATRAGNGYYIPIGHAAGTNLPVEKVIAALSAPMTDPRVQKVAHNAKYDYIVLVRNGLRVAPISFDSMLAEFIIDPASRNLGLKNLVAARLREEMTHIEELIGTGRKQISMAEVAIESAAPYAAADAECTLRLMPLLQSDLERLNGMQVLNEIEMPLTPVLAAMEMRGVLLDRPFFEETAHRLQKRLGEIEKQVFDSVGKPFNLNSTQQLSDVLFTRLRLDPPDRGRKTASGHFSTSADILESMKGSHPVVDMVLEHRELSKLKSTYVDSLPAALDPVTGRVHTSYSQTGAVTGRLSSSNPNLQNIPIRTEEGRRIRNGFIAAEGSVLLSVDYSQIELRIVAHMAQDETMLAAFRAGEDIHATTAAAVYGVDPGAVDKDMRRHAKAINFGLIYGMSAFGLKNATDLTLAEAENFVKAYFDKFPGIKKYLDEIRVTAAKEGFVETLLGRRRYFPNLMGGKNYALRSREEREAINSPIQGTAADIMKLAMQKTPPAIEAAKLKGQMLLQVHDELVLECPREELDKTAHLVKETMAEAYPLSIPLATEAKWGRSWGEMTDIK